MSPSKDEADAREHFAERYADEHGDVLDRIELKVIGAVWGANGFTTRAQADLLVERLRLEAGQRLLDIGAGRGWPGLYLAQKSGCDVVLSDLPVEGLVVAQDRARAEEIACLGAVAGSARSVPFRSHSFDALVHTDVLC